MKPTNNSLRSTKVTFSPDTEDFPQQNNLGESRVKVKRTRSISAPQLIVRSPNQDRLNWSTPKNLRSSQDSVRDFYKKKNNKEEFNFTMPEDLLSEPSLLDASSSTPNNIPTIDTKNLSDSTSHSPQTNTSALSAQLLQSNQSPQSPRSRGLSVSLRRLSSKYSTSSSTRSSPENLTPRTQELPTARSLDSSQSSPSISRKSPGQTLIRTVAVMHEAITTRLKEFSSSPSTSLSSSQREEEKAYLLSKLSVADLRVLAKNITLLKNSFPFKDLPTANQRILIQAECIRYLPSDSDFQDTNKFDMLMNGLQPYLAFEDSLVDRVIDLDDIQFKDFINSAAEAAFIKTWDKDSSDVDFELKKYLPAVKPTFARDFHHSDYFIQAADGSTKKLVSIDDFLNYFKGDENSDLTLLISNIASQNLGNFFQNALFLRQDANQQSQSILRSTKDIPLLPLAVAKASYTFKKRNDGSVDIFYERNSSQEINGAKEMRAKQLTDNPNTIAVQDANLKIQAKIRVNQDGTWNIFNPHVFAQGWI